MRFAKGFLAWFLPQAWTTAPGLAYQAGPGVLAFPRLTATKPSINSVACGIAPTCTIHPTSVGERQACRKCQVSLHQSFHLFKLHNPLAKRFNNSLGSDPRIKGALHCSLPSPRDVVYRAQHIRLENKRRAEMHFPLHRLQFIPLFRLISRVAPCHRHV
jgi:hypothetical protein